MDYADKPSGLLGSIEGAVRAVSANALPPTAPLSQDIIQRTCQQLDQAREISARLWSLRDRLFGSPPEGSAKDAARAEPSHFAGVYTEKSNDLSEALSTIDLLSQQLSNRL